MAGLDGIQNKLVPPDPIDKDLYDLEPEEKAKVKSTPGSLEEILNSLEADHDFLLKGDVFTKDVIETWLDYNGPRKWTQSVCVLIPMSLPSTSTFNRS